MMEFIKHYQLRLSDYSLEIPPFLQRKEDNTWRYPELWKSGGKSVAVSDAVSEYGNASGAPPKPAPVTLPTDPEELLKVAMALPRGAPPPTRRLSPREIQKREEARQRAARIRAQHPGQKYDRKTQMWVRDPNAVDTKQKDVRLPLTGRAALRRIFEEDDDT